MFSGILSPYLGIMILIVISIGITFFLIKNSFSDRSSQDTHNNLLAILFLATFAIYGLFFSLVSLFKAEPESIETIGADIFQINIGFTLILLGCGLAIFLATTESRFRKDSILKILICISGVLAIIGFILILNTGLVYQKFS